MYTVEIVMQTAYRISVRQTLVVPDEFDFFNNLISSTFCEQNIKLNVSNCEKFRNVPPGGRSHYSMHKQRRLRSSSASALCHLT